MYYLLLELPALRQLTLTRSEWARGIEKSLDSLIGRYHLDAEGQSEDFRLYRFPPISQGNVGELIAFLREIHQILEGVKDDLLGYTLLLHRSDSFDSREILRELKGVLLPAALEDGLWFTEEAANQLRGVVELTLEEETALYFVESIAERIDGDVQPLEEVVAAFAETKYLITRIKGARGLSGRGAAARGHRRLVFLRDESGGTARWAMRRAAESCGATWLEVEAGSLDPRRQWLASVPALGRGHLELEEEVRRFEQECYTFTFADFNRSYRDRPAAQKRNLWHEGIATIKAASRPMLLCFDMERWRPEEVTLLRELLEEADPEKELLLLCAGAEYLSLFGTLSDSPEERSWAPGTGFNHDAFLLQRAGSLSADPGESQRGLAALFSTYEEREMLLLYLLHFYGSQLSGHRLEELGGRLGFSPVEYRRIIDRFLADGILWARPDGTLIVFADPETQLVASLEMGAKNRLTRIVGAQLLHLHDQGELEQRPELFTTLLFAAGQGEQERLLRDYLWDRLPLFEDEAVGQWLFGFDALKRDRLGRMSELYRWRAKLCFPGDPGELPSREEGTGGLLEAEYNLALAEAHYMEGLMLKSLQLSKRALAQFMQLNDNHGRSRAYIQLGLVSMAKGDLTDAAAYLGYAVDSARGAKRVDLRIVAETLRNVTAFVYGNYSRVAQEAPELSREASGVGLSQWELFSQFLYGKALLELGRLEEAERAFAAVHRQGENLGETRAARVAQRWGWRAYGYIPEPRSREPYLPPVEGDSSVEWQLFELEGRLLEGGEAEFPLPEVPFNGVLGFHPLYRLSWDTGFSSVEDLVDISARRTMSLFLFALRAWFRARRGEVQLAREELRWLTREERVSQYDPARPIYLYLYSEILPPETEEETDDRRTVLGKSVKLLQERTSRLDRSGDKERYLRSNRWNRLLMREAKLLNML